jgi:hypothetical protein
MSRTYWIAKALRSFGYAGLIVFSWVLFIQFVNGRAESAPDVCYFDDCECTYGRVAGATEVLVAICFLYIGVWSIVLIGINLAKAYEFLIQSSQPSFTTRLFPAAVSVTPHFMESRDWGKTLPVLSRPFLGEYLTENPPVSSSGWGDYAFFSGMGAFVFATLTVVTALIGSADKPFFNGDSGCDFGFVYHPPKYDMDAFFNYTLFVVFLGITVVLIGQTRDFLQNARLSRNGPVPAGMERRK